MANIKLFIVGNEIMLKMLFFVYIDNAKYS